MPSRPNTFSSATFNELHCTVPTLTVVEVNGKCSSMVSKPAGERGCSPRRSGDKHKAHMIIRREASESSWVLGVLGASGAVPIEYNSRDLYLASDMVAIALGREACRVLAFDGRLRVRIACHLLDCHYCRVELVPGARLARLAHDFSDLRDRQERARGDLFFGGLFPEVAPGHSVAVFRRRTDHA